MVCIRTFEKLETFDVKVTRSDVDIFSFTGKFISPLTVYFYCRELWWDLFNVTDELGKGSDNLFVCWASFTFCDYRAFGVVGVGSLTKAYSKSVSFKCVGYVMNSLGCFT